jgi:phosphatidylglycerophosphate synthase
MGSGLPSREQYLARWAELHGGYDPRESRVVGPWLSLTYVLARPLARAGMSPDAVTLLSGAAAGMACLLAAQPGWLVAAAVAVVLSGLLDNLDGAVALLRDRASAWGFVLDSVVDRCADLLFLLALWLAGAPAGLCVVAGVLTFLLEYTRARAVAGGMPEIGVVTVWERGTRVVVTAMFLLAAAVAPGSAQGWAFAGAGACAALGVVGTGQLLVVVRRRLR